MYQNKLNILNEIKNFDCKQLREALICNGLEDMCAVFEDKNIDGEEFLKLSEMQVRLWCRYLDSMQTKRLWSIVQLARDDPITFFKPLKNSNTYSGPSRKNNSKYTPSQNNSDEHKTNFRNEQSLPTLPTHNEPAVVNKDKLYKSKNQKFDSNINNFDSKINNVQRTNQTKNNSSLYKIQSQQNVKTNFSWQDKFYKPHLATPPSIPICDPCEEQNIPTPSNSSIFGFGQTPQKKQMSHRNLNMSSPQNNIIPNSPNIPQKSPTIKRNLNVSLPPKKIIIPNQKQMNENLTKNINVSELKPSSIGELQNNLQSVTLKRSVSPSIQSRALPSCPTPTSSEGYNKALPKPPTFFPIETRKSISSDDEIYIYDVNFTNYTFEKWYRKINRDRARQLLTTRPNGSFLVRPSSKAQYICIVSLIYNQKLYNLPINKTKNNTLIIGNEKTVNTNEFESVKQIINYYTSNGLPLDFKGRQIKVNLHHIN